MIIFIIKFGQQIDIDALVYHQGVSGYNAEYEPRCWSFQ